MLNFIHRLIGMITGDSITPHKKLLLPKTPQLLPATKSTHPFDDDHVLFHWDHKNKQDEWTNTHAYQGVQVFGGIGSGKSSGPGKWLLLKFLERMFGMLVLCSKNDEAANLLHLAKITGRLKNVVLIAEPSRLELYEELKQNQTGYEDLDLTPRFWNPLIYENTRVGGGDVDAIVDTFETVSIVGNRIKGYGSGTGNDPFWPESRKRLMRNAIILLKFAGKGKGHDEYTNTETHSLTLKNIVKIVREAPKFNDNGDPIGNHGKDNFTVQAIEAAGKYVEGLKEVLDKAAGDLKTEVYTKKLTELEEIRYQYEEAKYYFTESFSRMASKTRDSVVQTLETFTAPLNTGIFDRIFGKHLDPDACPEVCAEGKIIILDIPVKTYNENGAILQSIYKLMWQRWAERRAVPKDKRVRPLVLYVDESQFFMNSYDAKFATTSRSSKVITVYLSQNINNYYSVMVSKNPKYDVDSLMGNLTTLIMMMNTDAETNAWCSKRIAQSRTEKTSLGQSNTGSSMNISEDLQNQVDPIEFTMLRAGRKNDGIAEAYVMVGGETFNNRQNYRKVAFNQSIDQNYKKLKIQ